MRALECHTVFVKDTPGQLTSDLLPSQTSGADEVLRPNKKENGAYMLIGELNSGAVSTGASYQYTEVPSLLIKKIKK
jgi:hypothetical protein